MSNSCLSLAHWIKYPLSHIFVPFFKLLLDLLNLQSSSYKPLCASSLYSISYTPQYRTEAQGVINIKQKLEFKVLCVKTKLTACL